MVCWARPGRPRCAVNFSRDLEVERAIRLLEAWDGRESVDSAAAAIAEVWLNKHLVPHIRATTSTEAAAKLVAFGSVYAATTYLHSPDAALGTTPKRGAPLLLSSLRTLDISSA